MELPDEGSSGDDGDFEVGEADLGLDEEDGLVSGFDGFEESEDDGSEDAGGGGSGGGSGGLDGDIQSAINSGVASLGAAGLRGRERERLETELEHIAGQFKLGYFGQQVVEKYLETDIQNIPPEYGLAAASIAFAVVVIYKRPDSDELLNELKMKVQELSGRGGPGTGDVVDEETTGETDDEEDNDE